MTLVTPDEGPCSPWITEADVSSWPGCSGYTSPVLTDAAAFASGIMYRASGRQWTGACGPATVRPMCRPFDAMSDRGWAGGFALGMGILSWGTCSGMTSGANVSSHYGHSDPREVDLGVFPVTEVTQVLIDGVTIPTDEYELQNYRRLVRMLPTASSVPTQRYGWPTAQRLDLPDTQPGTFSVTFMYGAAPPPEGILAARALGGNVAKWISGDPNQLPTRITSNTRQGISARTTDVEDIVSKGMLGIWIVDAFIQQVNPGHSRGGAQVWSPDVGRPRRLPRGVA